MHFYIIAVGQMKEPFYLAAQKEYCKRLGKYARVTIQEVVDDPVPKGEKDRLVIKERQGERLLKKAPGRFSVALDPGGKALSSEELAFWMEDQFNAGRGEMAFFLGGTLGLPDSVLQKSDYILSLSRLTFPHQLARVIVLEQLYRALRILKHEPYHY